MKQRKSHTNSSVAVDLMALAEFVERFEGKRVVVLGDFVADSFQYGDITRVSREAPVLILRHRETRVVPGGGANAANNLAALGAQVLPVTAVGDDFAGDSLVQAFREMNVDVSGILRVKGRTTPTKTRFLAGWTHTVGQQVLRVDYEPQDPLTGTNRKKIEQLLATRIKNADALAVSDYGFGIASPEIVRRATRSGNRRILVSLDSRYRLLAYQRAGVTAATPNEAEMEALHHTTIGRDTVELERCGRATLHAMKLDSLVVTRGKDGMAVFQPRESTVHLPVHGSDQA
ncbi:MAG TPA: PfkB family carbohydrate kinase, partial [Candidatus Sulfotelmatobacter sp.]|nr:PfkB family carbohydrate kinase [Candidatus Sulfotelmatobacter sp.]